MSSSDELFTPLDLAIHATVKEYTDPRTGQRGAAALSARLGLRPGTLSNKANPTMPDARLGLEESISLQLAADDYRILHATNSALGHCAYQMPLAPAGSDMEILDAYTAVNCTAGAKAEAIRAALLDGRVTAAEIVEIKDLFDKHVRAGLELIATLERVAS